MLNLGESQKEAILDHVVTNAGGKQFVDQVEAAVKAGFRNGEEVTGEEVRFLCEECGVTPHHHNAWGGCTNHLQRRGTLIYAGRNTQMRGKKSNARMTPVYTVMK